MSRRQLCRPACRRDHLAVEYVCDGTGPGHCPRWRVISLCIVSRTPQLGSRQRARIRKAPRIFAECDHRAENLVDIGVGVDDHAIVVSRDGSDLEVCGGGAPSRIRHLKGKIVCPEDEPVYCGRDCILVGPDHAGRSVHLLPCAGDGGTRIRQRIAGRAVQLCGVARAQRDPVGPRRRPQRFRIGHCNLIRRRYIACAGAGCIVVTSARILQAAVEFQFRPVPSVCGRRRPPAQWQQGGGHTKKSHRRRHPGTDHSSAGHPWRQPSHCLDLAQISRPVIIPDLTTELHSLSVSLNAHQSVRNSRCVDETRRLPGNRIAGLNFQPAVRPQSRNCAGSVEEVQCSVEHAGSRNCPVMNLKLDSPGLVRGQYRIDNRNS